MRLAALRFEIEDDGIGMSKEFVLRVFDPFEREDVPTRLSVEGTGLGMAIVKNLADLMGGTITVRSECGKGLCFTLDPAVRAWRARNAKTQLAER